MGLSFATFGSAEVGGGEVVDVGDEGVTVDVCGEGEVGDVTLPCPSSLSLSTWDQCDVVGSMQYSNIVRSV